MHFRNKHEIGNKYPSSLPEVHVRGRVKSITQDTKLDVTTVITVELHETTGNGDRHSFSAFATKFLASARSNSPLVLTDAVFHTP